VDSPEYVEKEPPRRQGIKFFDNSRRMTREDLKVCPLVSTVPLPRGLALRLFGMQRRRFSHAALRRIGGAARLGMQELRAFFFQSQELKMDADLVPSQRAADFLCGFTAAIF
jgi:hypothetical protein